MPTQDTEAGSEDKYGRIDDVGAVTWQVFFASPLNIFILFIACILFFGGVIYIYATYLYLGTPDFNAIYFPFCGIALLLVRAGMLHAEIEEDFLKQIAHELGYEYSESASMDSVSGSTFEPGHDQNLSNVISGTYSGHPVRIFNFQYTIGYGKNSHTYTQTIYELDYGETLPHILVNPIQGVPGEMETVELEGVFNDEFKLYVEKGKQMEIRELFEPDVMQQFMENYKGLTIEIYGSKLYVVRQEDIATTRDAFYALRDAADGLFSTLIPELRTIGSRAAVSPAI